MPLSRSERAYLDQLGDEQDRMLFEHEQWKAQRQAAGEATVSKILYRTHDNNAPAPSEPDAAPFNGDIWSDATVEALADVIDGIEARADRKLAEARAEWQ